MVLGLTDSGDCGKKILFGQEQGWQSKADYVGTAPRAVQRRRSRAIQKTGTFGRSGGWCRGPLGAEVGAVELRSTGQTKSLSLREAEWAGGYALISANLRIASALAF